MKLKEQLEEKEKLESSLPTIIDIGPFSIYVAFKQTLVSKLSSLTHALLGNLALMLRNQIENVSGLFKGQKAVVFAVVC